jgi:hypothetical protein
MRFLAIILLTIFTSCTRGPSKEQLRADLDHICAAQKSYAQTASIQGVSEAEIWAERAKRMREGLQTAQAKELVEAFLSPDSKGAEVFFEIAKSSGLENWSCMEFAKKR